MNRNSNQTNNNTSKRGRPKKKQILSTFTIRVQESYLKKLKAYDYYKRVSQRKVIEKALQEFFDGRQKELNEAVHMYNHDSQDL